jgi:hypothetical protein
MRTVGLVIPKGRADLLPKISDGFEIICQGNNGEQECGCGEDGRRWGLTCGVTFVGGWC